MYVCTSDVFDFSILPMYLQISEVARYLYGVNLST